MRIYCPQCKEVTSHKESIKGSDTNIKGLVCNTCGHFQPTNSITEKGDNQVPPRKSSNSSSPSDSSSSSSIVPVSRNAESSAVGGGLSIPQFDPSSLMPANLFTDSSSLPRTDQKTGNEAIASIKEKAITVQIANENIKLARSVVQAGTEHVKLQGDTINYAIAQEHNVGLGIDLEIERIGTQGKQVKHQIAGIGLQILNNKLGEEGERLIQSDYSLEAMRQATPLVQQEFQARIELQKVKVEVLKTTAQQARAKFESELERLIA